MIDTHDDLYGRAVWRFVGRPIVESSEESRRFRPRKPRQKERPLPAAAAPPFPACFGADEVKLLRKAIADR